MDLESLTLEQALDMQQLANLARGLVSCNLALELLDQHGQILLPRPATPSPCGQVMSHAAAAAHACQQEQRELCTAVLKAGQVRVTQCPEHCLLIGIPIRPYATTLGVLMACHAQPNIPTASINARAGSDASEIQPYSAELVTLLTTLLDQVIATAMHRLEVDDLAQELLDRYEQLNFLFDIARHISPTDSLHSTLDFVTNTIAQLFGEAHIVAIFHKGAIAHLAIPREQPLPSIAAFADEAQRLCESVASQIAQRKRTVVLPNLEAQPYQEETPLLFTALLATPILVENECYGTLNVLATSQAGKFVNSDVALLESVSRQVGSFLAHQKLFQKLNAFHHSHKMEALGRLAGGIAHDFNNILSAILGYGELAQEDLPADSQPHQNVGRLLKAGHRAKDLIQRILAFSRQREQRYEPVEIPAIMQEVLELLRVSLPATIEIRQDIDPACGTVLADPTQLHQVIMNLCTNAMHAMSEQGGVLEIELAEVELDAALVAAKDMPQGRYARITVRDTGCGMSPETMERIFDLFFTTKAIGKGTGMGLAMVYGIVKSHGGLVTVSSELEKGTTFHVFLPSFTSTTLATAAADVAAA
jgi:signal transduction histidine kinase